MGAHVVKLLGEDQEARELGKSFEARCVEDRWSQGMRDCLIKTTSTDKSQNCRIYLSDTQQERWEATLAAHAAAEAAKLPQSCEIYATMVQRAQRCETFSRETRDTLAKNLAASQAAWATTADKSSLDGTCAGAMRSLRTAAPDCFK
jgi:hypothetical protein